ncbi:MAG: MFS transporter [Planctomycetes bacterium]|nr:MFS transporter [Planctomycetota bacterium]
MADPQEGTDSIHVPPAQTVKGLRAMMMTGWLWGIWSSASGIGTAIFTGYVLWLGATQPDVFYLTCLAYLVCLFQPFIVTYTKRTARRLTVFLGGFFEVFFRFSIIGIPLLFDGIPQRLGALYLLILLGLIGGYAISPLLSDWLAVTIPESQRARFLSRRTLVTTLVAGVSAYVFGKVMDGFHVGPFSWAGYANGPERYSGFAWIFVVGLVTGVGGYALLLRAPLPPARADAGGGRGTLNALANIVRHRPFLHLLAFSIVWQFAMGLAGTAYPIFMLETLKLDYSTIAIYGNLSIIVQLVSYPLFGNLVSRFGSKPVMQMLLLPGAAAQLLWVFNSPSDHALLPVAMVLNGVFSAGMTTATSPLVLEMIPRRGDRVSYFVAWSMSVNSFYALAPLLGGVLTSRLADFHQVWWGYPIGSLQVIFLISAAAFILPVLLVTRVEERKAQSAGWLITQVGSGNPVTYLYNSFVMNIFSGETQRVKAAAGMALSGSRMAAEDLIHALSDLSPEVRRKAAEGLGMLGSEEAVAPLISQMADRDSDIRAEAAEALGKIRHPLGLDALLDALHDEDSRVRISAIRALGETGGQGIREHLYEHLCGPFDRQTFPTLVDVLGRLGEVRLVRPALEHLPEYRSPVIRAQLLNAVCRALGAEDTFYRLAILEEQEQVGRVDEMLQKAHRDLQAIREWQPRFFEAAASALKEIRQNYEQAQYEATYRGMVAVASRIVAETDPAGKGGEASDAMTIARGAAGALLLHADLFPSESGDQDEVLFASVCLCLCISALKDARPGKV